MIGYSSRMGNQIIAPTAPSIDITAGPATCPACQHGNEDARRSWWDKRRGRTQAKCRHETIEQDALVDTWDVCACTDAWHQ